MEANTLHCQSCGASVGSDALECPYCGSQLATVACPHCLTLVSGAASHCPHCGTELKAAAVTRSTLNCPDCRINLVRGSVAGLALDQCDKCGGIWVDQQTFEKIAADREERGEVMGSLPAQVDKPRTLATVHYRPCPCCAKLMNRQNYAHISGVVLNLCKQHGIWFERDELREVLAFIEDGGLERSRGHELAELAEQRRITAAAAHPASAASWEGTFTDSHPQALSLASLVESLVDHFFR
jgi:Zn-finger nucleic acid-binding protein/RNA polymerase subunit RPABC4/transcription elongation factor Spt4